MYLKNNVLVHFQPKSKTYKQAGKHVLFGIVDRPFVVLFVVLFGYERLTGVLDVVVVETAVEAAGRLVPLEAVLQVARVARGGENGRRNHKVTHFI